MKCTCSHPGRGPHSPPKDNQYLMFPSRSEFCFYQQTVMPFLLLHDVHTVNILLHLVFTSWGLMAVPTELQLPQVSQYRSIVVWVTRLLWLDV